MSITLAAAKGIVLGKDASILAENGGYLDLTRDWAKQLMSRMGLVKCNVTTALKITPNEFKGAIP